MGRTPRARSPRYPFVGLEEALGRAGQLVVASSSDADFRLEEIAKAWHMPRESSVLDQVVAALLQYGLIERRFDGKQRSFALPPRAHALLDERLPEAERSKHLRDAALAPKIFTTLIDHFPSPENASRRTQIDFLTLEHEPPFTLKAAERVLSIQDENTRYVNAGGRRLPTRRTTDDVGTSFDVTPGFADDSSRAKRASRSTANQPRNPLTDRGQLAPAMSEGYWQEEQLLDDDGLPILIRYRGAPTRRRYELLRDYLNMRLQRMTTE